MRRLAPLIVIAVVASSCRRPAPARPGMIAGLIRDAASGDAIEKAVIVLRRLGELTPVRDVTDANGAFMIPDLPAGHYEVAAYVARVLIGERSADVRPGELVGLDFTVGRVDVDASDLNAPGAPTLWHYRPRGADPLTGVVEGTVADLHFQRLAGAVVSVTASGTMTTAQAVTDDQGRFAVPALAPGSYDVSAYTSIIRRGQIEVRRSRVIVTGGEVVVVPLWLDTDGQ